MNYTQAERRSNGRRESLNFILNKKKLTWDDTWHIIDNFATREYRGNISRIIVMTMRSNKFAWEFRSNMLT